ncbi:hypothetical protein CYLTODRAFT_395176 [Cylindrobasidium torrendii FP15055 ss-10]|uniref:Uncharacterized protein n=1 Tax=Cylindrobasidium torrendii FP15055 ss-10 TaxID=1314674 RepID=A0A0D7BEM5_9AGAR|nr:hypothetical protein CYLTODRAFT_395176 [Cylindrobasidium torrendii FP15055 ss-10]
MTRSTTPSAPVNPDSAANDLAEELSALSVSSIPSIPTKARESRRQKARARAPERPSSAATTTTTLPSPPSSPKNKKRKHARKIEPGLGSRPIVDDVSESGFSSEPLDDGYDEAVQYLNSFLTNPDDSVNRLTLLQSMIIELGLAGSALPASLTAARAHLKSRAFVNIRDYLAARGQGPDALKDVLYPSRAALVKDIRRKRNQASKQWVKQHGLNVLLVQCFH